jgi:D-3-phosphoglycerate dehydrogenase / 2-oxoglutarate reductase
MSYKIYIAGSPLVAKAQDILIKNGCVVEQGSPKDSAEETALKLKKFNPDGMIVRQGKISKQAIENAPDLKVISKHGVGVDNIDTMAAFQSDIAVFITPNANFESVAEHTLAMIFALLKRIPFQDRRLRQGVFDKVSYDGEDLVNKSIGIVGYGRIGRRFAELASCISKEILVYDPFMDESGIPPYITRVNDIKTLISTVDILTFHCALTEETRGIINNETLSLMKPSSFIINLSRGAIIKESDLIAALQEKKRTGPALDTFEVEPPDLNNPLFRLDNVIMTSHIGGSSKDSLVNMGVDAVNNVLNYLKGENPDPHSMLKPKI